jgi:uncharacterized membrane protein
MGLFIAARLLHILAGIFWVGSVMTSVFFLEPSAAAVGGAGDRVLAHIITRRRLTTVMAAAAITAVAAGAFLYWTDSGGLRLEWITSHTGLTFTAGAIAALTAFALAALFLKPGFDRLAALAAQSGLADSMEGSEAARQQAEELQARLRPASLVQVALLVVAAAAMATARYVP